MGKGDRLKNIKAKCLMAFFATVIIISGYHIFFSGYSTSRGERNSHVEPETTKAAEMVEGHGRRDGGTGNEGRRAVAGEERGREEESDRFVLGEAETGSFPQEVLEAAERINAGQSLAAVTGLKELEGFYALTGTKKVSLKDKKAEQEISDTEELAADTEKEAVDGGEIKLYVPNLLPNLKEVSILFYNQEDGKWEVVPVVKADSESKTVTASLSGSGILTVIYKRGEGGEG